MVSLVYYVKVLKVMILDAPPEEETEAYVEPWHVPAAAGLYASVLAAAVVFMPIFSDTFMRASRDGVGRFHQPLPPSAAPPATAEVRP